MPQRPSFHSKCKNQEAWGGVHVALLIVQVAPHFKYQRTSPSPCQSRCQELSCSLLGPFHQEMDGTDIIKPCERTAHSGYLYGFPVQYSVHDTPQYTYGSPTTFTSPAASDYVKSRSDARGLTVQVRSAYMNRVLIFPR